MTNLLSANSLLRGTSGIRAAAEVRPWILLDDEFEAEPAWMPVVSSKNDVLFVLRI